MNNAVKKIIVLQSLFLIGCGSQNLVIDTFIPKPLVNKHENISAKLTFDEEIENFIFTPEQLQKREASVEINFGNTQAKLFENILNNIFPLSILSEIKKEIESLKEEENFLLISEFNKLVNEEIKNQPAPFIYEKIGAKFSHFFIDEFQDTSKMQWDNLKPLIENSLSSENSTLTLAGDPKQSIYRWRGGDVAEFMNLLANESPFFCDKNIINLNTNYRSSREIVHFNNSLFKHISELYADNSDLIEILNFPKQNHSRYLSILEVMKLVSKAKAFVHAGIEDFGIAPVEAQSTGTPRNDY